MNINMYAVFVFYVLGTRKEEVHKGTKIARD